jgi:signal transduction histidine kinase
VNPQIEVILIAAGCTGAVGAMGLSVIRLLHRAPLRVSLQAGSATAVLAIVAGTLGTANAMFVSRHDLGVVVMVCVVAGLVAFGFCWLLGRQVETSSLALRQAARQMGDEGPGFRSPAGPMAAEFAALSRELAATAAKLQESQDRERRLEQSRRQLVAWVSHDLRAPLAGLRAMAEALEDGIAADADRYHRQIRAEVARLSGMVDDLFELSRIHSGTQSPADGGAGLGLAIVRGIVEAHQGQVRAVNTGDGCRFEVRLPALAPCDDICSDGSDAAGESPRSWPAGLLIPGL